MALLGLGAMPLAALAQEPQAAPPASQAPATARKQDHHEQKARHKTEQEGGSANMQLNEVKVNGHRQDDEFRADRSTVGARTPTRVHDLPQTVTVIDQALMRSQGAASLNDALRNIPGIVLGAGEGGQIGNNIYLRGFSARTDVFLNGFRDRGQYQRDLFSLESVEVLEGPASLLFGRGSTGGVINQVSKRPSLKASGEVNLTLGTDGYYRSTVDVDHALSHHSALRFEAMGQIVDATRSSIIENRDYGIAPSLALGIGTPTEVTLSLLSQHNRDVPDYGFPMVTYSGATVARPLAAPFSNYYGYTNNRYAQDVNVFSVDVTHHFGHDITLRSNTQYSGYRTQVTPTPTSAFWQLNDSTNTWSRTSLPASTPLDQMNVAAQVLARSIRDTSLYNQTDLLFKLRTGPAVHHFAVGTEIGHDDYLNNQFGSYNFNYNNGAGLGSNLVGIINLGQSNSSALPSGANIYQVPSATTDTGATALAGYFNDQIDFGEHWKLVGGLRWDQFSVNQSYTTYCYTYSTPDITDPGNASCSSTGKGSLANANSGLIASNTDPSQIAAVQAHNANALQHPLLLPYSTSHADYHWSSRAGLIWQPSAAQSYYFAYGTSFDPLALQGNNTTGALPTNAASEAAYEAGGGLAPQQSTSYELGGKWDVFDKRLSLSTALFQVTMDNVRGTDPVTGDVTLQGNQRVRGTELKAVGRILPFWQVMAGYTYLDGKVIASENPAEVGKNAPNMARNGATVWSTWDLDRHWQTGLGFSYSSNIWTNASNTQQVPGYTRGDATLAYQQRRWSLRLNLQNFTDRHYFYAVSGGRATPADGRRALFTFSYHFL